MKKLMIFLAVVMWSYISYCQTPHGFNYQAVARETTGNIIANEDLIVKIGLLTDTINNIYVWEEQHSVKTNPAGVFNLVVGTGTRTQGSAAQFSDINWSAEQLFVRIKITRNDVERTMGSAKLWSVPYSLVSEETKGMAAGAKLAVVSEDDASEDALFEVKRQDGQTVFAVYNDAVNVYVPRSEGKGAKGGFSIGGFGSAKLGPQDYFRVTPDSVRVYIDPAPTAKGAKGGFSIGGYGEAKGINDMYFNLTGSSSVNTVENESPQILWYPVKKAFLAGSIHIGAVDSVGQNSTALGYRSIAMGDFSQAFGYKAKAFGDYSTSIGKNSIAGARSGGVSTASSAFAFGNAAMATGDDSYALGSGSVANAYRTFAFGYNAQATSTNALALGNGSIASGTNSAAIGYQSQAQGDKSIAIGSYYSYSYFIPIINLGKGDTGGSKGIDDFLPIRPVIPISTLSRSFSRANIASGQYSVALGNGNLAQNGGLVFGSNSDALGFGAVALGTSAKANQTNSLAIGYNSVANGIYSMAIGNNTTANSFGELSLGQWNESVSGTVDTWNPNDLLFTVGNGVNSSNRSNALTIYKNGKTIVRGRYAVSTFNYQTLRWVIVSISPLQFAFRDYIYGVYTYLNRDDPSIEYYYSGWFGASGTSGTYYGLYADTRTGGSIDVAEYIYDSAANTQPADVVVADPMNKESVIKSSQPYQSSVLGVISTKPHMTMGMDLVVDEKTGEPLPNAKPSTRLALTGRVPVNVTGENGAILPGDLLTTSSTPGHAMKWTLLDVNTARDFNEMKKIISENEKRRNAVIGKAVESFSGSGTGKIMVLISLQ